MTDPSAPPDTHTVPSVQSHVDDVNAFAGSAPPTASALLTEDQVEDYTIKCICGYQDDDGNSVFCERCDTWQHTECYYADEHGRVPTGDELKDIEHFCTDCKPRRINTKIAINRQRIRKEDLDPSERKIKKTTSKSHKKKIKVPENHVSQTNGWAHGATFEDRMSRSPLEPPISGKRTKVHHRPSSSVNHPLTQSNPTSHPHKMSHSTLNSPSKMPPKHMPNNSTREIYSVDFLKLYDNDSGDRPLSANLFSDIKITRDLSLWSHDVEALKEATNGSSHPQVFHRIEHPLHTLKVPELRKEHAQNESVVIDGRHPRWIYLTIDTFTPKSSIIGELKGEIGHMKDYIQNPDNQWEYLRHPAPFVFFHPKLPIYIDTRIEGTTCRYLRRSCDPNLIMTTILENDSEYHFCFTAKHDIQAGAELTIGWVLDENMRKIFNPNHNGVKQEIGGDHGRYIADWANNVLPEFGGCACDAESGCAFARYSTKIKFSPKERNELGKNQTPNQSSYSVDSRDGSEHNDDRSASASKSGSRDMTPNGNGIGDSGAGPGLEISDRDKRKIAALEKGFEKLENDRHQPSLKKKKRNSGGSNVNTPMVGTSKQLGHPATSFSQPNTPSFPTTNQFVDANLTRRKSGSPIAKSSVSFTRQRNANLKHHSSHPITPVIPSPSVRQNYVSAAVQTDPDGHDWYRPLSKPALARKPYISLTKRLLLRSQNDRKRLEEGRRSSDSVVDNVRPGEQHEHGPPSATTFQQDPVDIDMSDANLIRLSSPGHGNTGSADQLAQFLEQTANGLRPSKTSELKYVPPSNADNIGLLSEQPVQPSGSRLKDLHVQLPLKPVLFTDSSSASPTFQTPSSAVPQSPYTAKPASTYPVSTHPPNSTSTSHLIQPSPAKKKVSLSDYMKRKGSQTVNEKQASGSPEMQHNALRPASTGNIKTDGRERSAVVDPPRDEDDSMMTGNDNKVEVETS